jgi:hypothetical protein
VLPFLHRIVRENLESYLALASETEPMGEGVPAHVENEFRSYLAPPKAYPPVWEKPFSRGPIPSPVPSLPPILTVQQTQTHLPRGVTGQKGP